MNIVATPDGLVLQRDCDTSEMDSYVELDLGDTAHLHIAAILSQTQTHQNGATVEVDAALESLGLALGDNGGLEHIDADVVAVPAARCRVCGCSDYDACLDPGGEPCNWVEPDLCSECAPLVIQPRTVLDQAEEWRHRMDGMMRVLGGAS